MEKSFGIVDYIVFLGTLVISMLIGCYYAFFKTQKTNEELLSGNRNIGIIPCCMSLVATYMSAILVLGYSGEIYNTGTLILECIVGTLIFLPLGGCLFLPTLYPLKLTSAYEYLERRFDSRGVRLIATVTFIIQIILYMGVVLFAPAVALNAVVDFPVWASIISVGGCAAIYTSIGGLKAVVWTDVFQILMMFSGMIAIIIKGTVNLGGPSKVLEIANAHGRIEFLNFTIDPFLRHSTLSIFFGQGAMWMSAYGCHQSTVQRYCSMESFRKAFMTLLLTAPVLAFTMSLAGITGLVVFSNYAGCDPISLGFISRHDQITPFYVLDQLSSTVGILGLFIACLFSGALSTISSAINSLAAVTWVDFCSKIKFFQGMTEESQGLITKLIGLIYGGIAISMGFVAQNLGGVLSAAIIVNGAVAGPLLGVFILGILIPVANKKGAMAGMLTAHFLTFWISIGGLLMNVKPKSLPFSIDNCSNETLSKVTDMNGVYERLNATNHYELEDIPWPQKFYTISYVLYPLVGAVITVTVGSIVSLVTGASSITAENEQYIHPLIVKINRILKKQSKGDIQLGFSHQKINSCKKNDSKLDSLSSPQIIVGNGNSEKSVGYTNAAFDTS